MGKKFKIALPEVTLEDSDIPDTIYEEAIILKGELGKRGDNTQLMKIIDNADAIIFTSSNDISSDVMKSAPNLKIAFKSGAWPENIDFKYAKDNKIAVGWTPMANAQSVAEYTIMLILALQRKFLLGYETLNKGGWRESKHIGYDLAGKTVGIVGLGGIGYKVATMLKSFDANIIAFDPYQKDEVFNEAGIVKATFEDLVQQSDIVSLHCILTDETKELFNISVFRRMKSSAFIVNTARGGLINETDLINAIKGNEIQGAALDVFSEEPLSLNNELRNLENVILTPHVSAKARESAIRECVWAIQGALDYLKGREVKNATIIKPD